MKVYPRVPFHVCVNGGNSDTPSNLTAKDCNGAIRSMFQEVFKDGDLRNLSLFVLFPENLITTTKLFEHFIPAESYHRQNCAFKTEIGALGNLRILVTGDVFIRKGWSCCGRDIFRIPLLVTFDPDPLEQQVLDALVFDPSLFLHATE